VSQDKRSKSMSVSPASFSIRAVVVLLEEEVVLAKACSEMTPGNEAEVRKGRVGGGIDNGSQ